MRKKLKALGAEVGRLPASERPDPKKAIADPAKLLKNYDPEEVIAVFEDRGKGIKTQEPTERDDSVTETDAEDGAPPEADRWPPPGRAVVTRPNHHSRAAEKLRPDLLPREGHPAITYIRPGAVG